MQGVITMFTVAYLLISFTW